MAAELPFCNKKTTERNSSTRPEACPPLLLVPPDFGVHGAKDQQQDWGSLDSAPLADPIAANVRPSRHQPKGFTELESSGQQVIASKCGHLPTRFWDIRALSAGDALILGIRNSEDAHDAYPASSPWMSSGSSRPWVVIIGVIMQITLEACRQVEEWPWVSHRPP